jgi:hypothetical protein
MGVEFRDRDHVDMGVALSFGVMMTATWELSFAVLNTPTRALSFAVLITATWR